MIEASPSVSTCPGALVETRIEDRSAALREVLSTDSMMDEKEEGVVAISESTIVKLVDWALTGIVLSSEALNKIEPNEIEDVLIEVLEVIAPKICEAPVTVSSGYVCELVV